MNSKTESKRKPRLRFFVAGDILMLDLFAPRLRLIIGYSRFAIERSSLLLALCDIFIPVFSGAIESYLFSGCAVELSVAFYIAGSPRRSIFRCLRYSLSNTLFASDGEVMLEYTHSNLVTAKKI